MSINEYIGKNAYKFIGEYVYRNVYEIPNKYVTNNSEAHKEYEYSLE